MADSRDISSPIGLIMTPTSEQLKMVKQMLEITDVSTVGYGEAVKIDEVTHLLDDIARYTGAEVTIGGLPTRPLVNPEISSKIQITEETDISSPSNGLPPRSTNDRSPGM